MPVKFWALLGLLCLLPASSVRAAGQMDRDLLEVTVPRLEQLYAEHRYTVKQVVEWELARIARYNGIYRSVQTVDGPGALAVAAAEDADAAANPGLVLSLIHI